MKYRIGIIISVLLSLSILATSCGKTTMKITSDISSRTVKFLFIAYNAGQYAQGSSGIQEYNYPAGTGFIVNNDGYVITANHLLEMGKQFVQQSPAQVKKVVILIPPAPVTESNVPFDTRPPVNDYDIIARDETHDLALLKIKWNGQNEPTLPFMLHGYNIYTQTDSTISLGNAPIDTGITKNTSIAVTGYSTDKTRPGPETKTGTITSGEMTEVLDPVLTDSVGLAASSLDVSYSLTDYYETDVISDTLLSGSPVYSPDNSAIMGMCINIPNSSGKTAVIPGKYILDLLKSNGVNIK